MGIFLWQTWNLVQKAYDATNDAVAGSRKYYQNIRIPLYMNNSNIFSVMKFLFEIIFIIIMGVGGWRQDMTKARLTISRASLLLCLRSLS